MCRRRAPLNPDLERRLPHRVDVSLPRGHLGLRLKLMLEWCRANVPDDSVWAYHDHEGFNPNNFPLDAAHFYFLEASTAERFSRKWL